MDITFTYKGNNNLLSSGTNRFYGIQATVRKFLFFKKKFTAMCPISDGTPLAALATIYGEMTPEERHKATYRAFVQTIEVHGWCDGKPLGEWGKPSWWKKWDYATLTEKAKGWHTNY